jgi:transglutaminase-like putative cysteine protease
MELHRAFRLSVYVVVALGGLALGAGGLMATPILALFLVALAATWWLRERLGARAWLTSRGDKLAAISLAVVAAVDLGWFAASFLDAFARLVCLLLLVRLTTWRVTRELRAAGFLSFSMLAAASAVAFGVAFLPLFVTYLATAILMLVLFHLATEAEAAGVSARGMGAGVAIVVVIAVLGTLGLTALLFIVIPRVEAALPFGARQARALTGFTDRVELGSVGVLETDDTVAMRVFLPHGAVGADELPHLRWRGLALDRFDGRIWTATARRYTVFRASEGIPVSLARLEGHGRMLTQEVYQEPFGTETLFAVAPAIRLRMDGAVRLDDAGGLSLPTARARTTYTVESALGARVVERLGAAARERYLDVPALTARIADLARDITAGVPEPAAKAARLTGWLSRELRYSLDLRRHTDLEPLDEFLFVRKSGNCEYFASALAVMLRTVGVPTRVVNGFQRGEWNPYGNYWVVRMRDAHSWVEAHVDGAWVTLDPSPRGETPPAPLTGVALYLDGLRMRWYRYVVGWSRQDQMQAAGAVRRLAWTGQSALRWPDTSSLRTVVLYTVLGVAVLGAIWWGVRGSSGRGHPRRRPLPAFYARALRALARRGLRPAPSETAREFGDRAGASLPSAAKTIRNLTLAYERMRFGGVGVTPTEARALVEEAARLRRLRG